MPSPAGHHTCYVAPLLTEHNERAVEVGSTARWVRAQVVQSAIHPPRDEGSAPADETGLALCPRRISVPGTTVQAGAGAATTEKVPPKCVGPCMPFPVPIVAGSSGLPVAGFSCGTSPE